MDMDEQAPPPAKHPKLDTDSSEYGSNGTTKCIKSSYASDVSHRLYSDKETVDVFFTFEDSNERVSAHKCVLSSASKVFRAMMCGPMAKAGDILLRDTPTEAFKIVMKFCYLDEIKLKLNQIEDVMKLLDHYGMTECLELCGRFWADNWNIDDICTAYSWAINLHMTEFREFCERKISKHTDAVFRTDGFICCSYEVLDHMLSLKSLQSDESTLLEACLKWARKQCELDGGNPNKLRNVRKYWKDVLHKIRNSPISNTDISKHWSALRANDVTRLKTIKNEGFLRWIDKQAVEYIFVKKEFCRKLIATCPIVNVLETNQAISFVGLYIVRMMPNDGVLKKKIAINLSIKEQKNDDNAPKLIHTERVTVMKTINDYVQLKPSPVYMKPNTMYHIEFKFESKICFIDEVANSTLKHDDLNIHIRTENNDAAKCLIKGFKFIPVK